MPQSRVIPLSATALYERRLRRVRVAVLSLACAVGLSLVTALVFGAYNFITDRPAKELFLGASG